MHSTNFAPKGMSDEEINEFHSNLREVMLYIKYSKDKAKLDEIIEGDSNFLSVERQAAEVINIVTGSKLKYPTGKGDVNMCQAIQQIAEMFHLSESESNEAVKQYW